LQINANWNPNLVELLSVFDFHRVSSIEGGIGVYI